MSAAGEDAAKIVQISDARVQAELAAWRARALAAESTVASMCAGKRPPPPEFMAAYDEASNGGGKRFIGYLLGDGTGGLLDRQAIHGRTAEEVWEELRRMAQ